MEFHRKKWDLIRKQSRIGNALIINNGQISAIIMNNVQTCRLYYDFHRLEYGIFCSFHIFYCDSSSSLSENGIGKFCLLLRGDKSSRLVLILSFSSVKGLIIGFVISSISIWLVDMCEREQSTHAWHGKFGINSHANCLIHDQFHYIRYQKKSTLFN